jgi:hypothetical protein
MRLLITMPIAAAAIALGVGHPHAAPAAAASEQKAAGFTQLVQGFPEDLFGGFCPAGQFYSCWVEPSAIGPPVRRAITSLAGLRRTSGTLAAVIEYAAS